MSRKEGTNLEGGAHVFDHQPKDLAAHVEYPVDGTGSISGNAEAKIKFDGLQEGRWLVALGVLNSTEGRCKDGDVVV